MDEHDGAVAAWAGVSNDARIATTIKSARFNGSPHLISQAP